MEMMCTTQMELVVVFFVDPSIEETDSDSVETVIKLFGLHRTHIYSVVLSKIHFDLFFKHSKLEDVFAVCLVQAPPFFHRLMIRKAFLQGCYFCGNCIAGACALLGRCYISGALSS